MLIKRGTLQPVQGAWVWRGACGLPKICRWSWLQQMHHGWHILFHLKSASLKGCLSKITLSMLPRVVRWPVFQRPGRYFTANLVETGKKPAFWKSVSRQFLQRSLFVAVDAILGAIVTPDTRRNVIMSHPKYGQKLWRNNTRCFSVFLVALTNYDTV